MRVLEFGEEPVSALVEPSSVAIVELGSFAVHSPRQPELLSQEIVGQMGKLVTVSTFRIGDAPHDIIVRTTPMRYSDDMKISAYADQALTLVAERRAGRLALDTELTHTHMASVESTDYFAQRIRDLREAFHSELLACDARKNREVVARYMRNRDDLEATMQLAQERADRRGEALLGRYTELSDDEIHDYAAGAYYRLYETGHHYSSAAAKSPRRRVWLHRLKVRIEDYSDVVLGAMDAWWWRAGDFARWLTHAGRA